MVTTESGGGGAKAGVGAGDQAAPTCGAGLVQAPGAQSVAGAGQLR